MAGQTTITLSGNLTADPELRFTQSGLAVANFTVASTARVFDRSSNEWKDDSTLFMRVTVWKKLAEVVAAELGKGIRVMLTGDLQQKQYVNKDGDTRYSYEVTASDVAVMLIRPRSDGQSSTVSPGVTVGASSGDDTPF